MQSFTLIATNLAEDNSYGSFTVASISGVEKHTKMKYTI